MTDGEAGLSLIAAPGGGSHWKVYRGTTFLGWVHRIGRRWRARLPFGRWLPAVARRRDALAALEGPGLEVRE